MNSDIYISASRRDFEAVSKIKSILHSAGYTYSGDIQSIQAASDFEQTIRAEIISSKAVLCVLSGNSSSSVYTEKDLRLAIKENKTIIPIIIDNTELVNLGKIGHFLLEIPVIRLNPYDSKSAKVILLNEIEKRCGTKVQKNTLIPCANHIKNVQYDVFISCKREDYPFARKVYQYLREHKYNVFLADTELRKKGNAEYGEIIDEALDSATHMVIVATKPEYIMSAYVKSEWRTFIEEKRSGRKMGNIVTLIEFNISELPISLRHFQSFNINSYLQITDYLPLFINRKESTNDFNIKYDEKDFQNIKPQYNVAEPFLMAIEDVFHIVGRGMVATGRIGAGKISVGDTLNIIRFGDKIKATCVGIEHKRKLIESAEAGENSDVGLLLRGLEPNDIKRGHVLTKSESILSSKKFSCDCLFFDKIISPRLTFYILTMNVRGNISFASNSIIQSYEIVPAIISLDIPAPIIEHTHFAIRYKDKTVGLGIIKHYLL